MSDEKLRNHLVASDPETWDKPEDMTWGDKFLRPDKPLLQRHREIARMCAHGKTNKEIAQRLHYTESRVSILLSNQKIKDEVERYRDKLFTVDTETRLKELTSDSLNVIEEILMSPTIPPEKKEAAAKWVLEKTSGKPAQQIDLKGDISIGVFLDQLDKLTVQQRGAPLDVTPKPTLPGGGGEADLQESGSIVVVASDAPQDDFTAWLAKNM